jgi:hypothetical protein
VDDWIIYTNHAEARLKKAADKVIKWTNENGFRISAEKKKSMFIHRKNRVLERRPRIRIWINNVEIEMRNHHRILGLIFDQQIVRLALGKIQRTYKNLHGRESWVRGEHQTKHLEKDKKPPKNGLQCWTRSNRQSDIRYPTDRWTESDHNRLP